MSDFNKAEVIGSLILDNILDIDWFNSSTKTKWLVKPNDPMINSYGEYEESCSVGVFEYQNLTLSLEFIFDSYGDESVNWSSLRQVSPVERTVITYE